MQNKRLMKEDWFQLLVVFLSAGSLFFLIFLGKLHQKLFSGKITPKDNELFFNDKYLNYWLLALVLIFFLTLFSAVGYFELKEKPLKLKPYQSLTLESKRTNKKFAKGLSILIIFFSIFFVVFSSLMFENMVVKYYIVFASVMFFTGHLYLIHFWTKGIFVANTNQKTKGEKIGK